LASEICENRLRTKHMELYCESNSSRPITYRPRPATGEQNIFDKRSPIDKPTYTFLFCTFVVKCMPDKPRIGYDHMDVCQFFGVSSGPKQARWRL